MKKLVSVAILLLIGLSSFAQVEEESILKGGFCSFEAQGFSIEKGLSLSMGGQAGFILKDFRLG